MTSTVRKVKEYKTKVHEKLYYNIYEGDEVVTRGEIQGRSFTQLGKVRLAEAIIGEYNGGAPNFNTKKLDKYRILISGPTYILSSASVVSWNSDGSEGLITAQTKEFTTLGRYLRVQGFHNADDVTSYYHYVTTDVTVGTGQSVRFFVEYSFNNLGNASGGMDSGVSQGNSVCAATLFDWNSGNGYFGTPIGRMVIHPYDGGYQSLWNNDIAMSVSSVVGGTEFNGDAYLLISGVQWSLGNNYELRYLKVTSSAANDDNVGIRVFHTWSYSPTADETGVFRVKNTLSPADWLDMQTDIAFTFG